MKILLVTVTILLSTAIAQASSQTDSFVTITDRQIQGILNRMPVLNCGTCPVNVFEKILSPYGFGIDYDHKQILSAKEETSGIDIKLYHAKVPLVDLDNAVPTHYYVYLSYKIYTPRKTVVRQNRENGSNQVLYVPDEDNSRVMLAIVESVVNEQ